MSGWPRPVTIDHDYNDVDEDDNDDLTQVHPTLAGIAARGSTSESLRVWSVTMGHTWDVKIIHLVEEQKKTFDDPDDSWWRLANSSGFFSTNFCECKNIIGKSIFHFKVQSVKTTGVSMELEFQTSVNLLFLAEKCLRRK